MPPWVNANKKFSPLRVRRRRRTRNGELVKSRILSHSLIPKFLVQ